MLPGKLPLLLLLLMGPAGAKPSHPFALPQSAVIHIGEHFTSKDAGASNALYCKDYRITTATIRKKFMTYHKLTGRDVHDHYQFANCGIAGTVEVKGTTYKWRADALDTVETTYPDGEVKILGGTYTDDLSGS